MADATPVKALVCAALIVSVLLVAWWAQLVPAERSRRLVRIASSEAASGWPPADLLAQGEWLVTHRAARVQGLVGLVALLALIGWCEGAACRAQAVFGGFLLSWFASGVVLLGGLPLLGVWYLLAPWPVPFALLASVLSGLVGLLVFALALGRPYVV